MSYQMDHMPKNLLPGAQTTKQIDEGDYKLQKQPSLPDYQENSQQTASKSNELTVEKVNFWVKMDIGTSMQPYENLSSDL